MPLAKPLVSPFVWWFLISLQKEHEIFVLIFRKFCCYLGPLRVQFKWRLRGSAQPRVCGFDWRRRSQQQCGRDIGGRNGWFIRFDSRRCGTRKWRWGGRLVQFARSLLASQSPPPSAAATTSPPTSSPTTTTCRLLRTGKLFWLNSQFLLNSIQFNSFLLLGF